MRPYLNFILAFVILQLIATAIVYFLYTERSNWLLENDKKQFMQQVKTVRTIYADTAEQIYHLMETDIIMNIFIKARYADDEEKNKLRRELYDSLKTQYKNLLEHDIRQLHFHLPDGTSFLRMHKPEMYGDTLLEFRESIGLVIETQKPVIGFEIGRLYSGFRHVFPLFDRNGAYISSVEISFDPNLFFKHVSMETAHVDLLEKSSIVKRKIIPERQVWYKPNVYEQYVEFQMLNHQCSVKPEHVNFIKSKMLPLFDAQKDDPETSAMFVDIDDFTYSVVMVPIANIAGEKDAAYLVGYLPNWQVSKLHDLIIFLYLLFTLINIMINLFIWRTSKARELKQLTENLEERIKKSTEANLEQERLMFEQARYAQLGEMMNMVAHQWRQPINAISAAAIQLNLKSELKQLGEHDIEETSRFIQKETKDMSQIINDFMNFFKPDTRKTLFRFDEVLDEVEKLIGPQLKSRGISLERTIGCIEEVHGHKKELIHIILNLVSNARDALEAITDNPKITIETHSQDDLCVIRVSDNGPGIDESIIERVFDPYFTTKEQGKGTGIGLYMAKEMIVKDFLGSFTVENLQTGGACFTITLPSISSQSSETERSSDEPGH